MSTTFDAAAARRQAGPVDPKPPLSPNPPEIAETLEAAWGEAPGLKGWFGTVDHKVIGIRYLFTAFAFLVIGGLEALVMRIQLAGPDAIAAHARAV